ncbi:MAG: hypothetical protein RL077_3945 [Verrucomicrobiota bacterium]
MQLTKHWTVSLDDYTIDLAWSPNGAILAAASAAGPISLFATDDGTCQHTLPGHAQGTNVLAWQPPAAALPTSAQTASHHPPPGSVLASGGQDGAVKFWDAAAGQHTASAKLGSAWVEHLAWKPVSHPAPNAPAVTPRASLPMLFAAAGRTLVALHADGTRAHTFQPAPKTITALAAQPAGGSLAIAYFGGVVLWDADDFIVQKEFPYSNGIHALIWSPNNDWLVSGNQDPSVHLWRPAAEIELNMSGYETKVKFLTFDHSSHWLATSGGKDACLWDCTGNGPEGREPMMLPHEAPVVAVAFQHTHGLLATAAQDGVVQIWSPERRAPLRATVKMPAAATKLVWSPDDRSLAIGSERGAVYVLKCEA